MNLHQIEYFIKVYEELNMSKAAQQLFITQQGLSRTIIALESELGVKLFIRGTNGLTPTESGNSFYHYACSVSRNLQYAQNELKNIKEKEEKRILHIGVSDGVFPSLDLAKPLAKFKEEHPDTYISPITGADVVCKELLLSGKIHCSFQVGAVTENTVQSLLLHQEPIFAWVSKKNPLAAKKSVSLNDLVSQPLIMVNDQYSYRKTLNALYRAKEMKPYIKYMTNDLSTIYYLAVQNEGIALHPQYWQNMLVQSDELVALPVADIDYAAWQVYLCCSRQTPADSIEKQFIEFIINHYMTFL